MVVGLTSQLVDSYEFTSLCDQNELIRTQTRIHGRLS